MHHLPHAVYPWGPQSCAWRLHRCGTGLRFARLTVCFISSTWPHKISHRRGRLTPNNHDECVTARPCQPAAVQRCKTWQSSQSSMASTLVTTAKVHDRRCRRSDSLARLRIDKLVSSSYQTLGCTTIGLPLRTATADIFPASTTNCLNCLTRHDIRTINQIATKVFFLL
jgi:hypothetical protein